MSFNDKTFYDHLGKSEKVTVAKFYNDSCYLCEAVKPVFQTVSQKYDELCDFIDVPASKGAREIFKKYSPTGVPTIVIFQPGSTVGQEIPWLPDREYQKFGGHPEEQISEYVEAALREMVREHLKKVLDNQ